MKRDDRVTRWSQLLGLDLRTMGNPLDKLTEDFKLDHSQQVQIHHDCEKLQKRLSIFAEADLRNALELLITYYCKIEKVPYRTGMHEVLAAFMLMGHRSLREVYATFRVFISKMMPRVFSVNNQDLPFATLFHLLLMYHEPVLCNTLDGKMLQPSTYADQWFLTLFACSLDVSLLLAFWEFCLTEKNYTLPYFFGLVIVSRGRDKILSKRNLSGREENLFPIQVSDRDELETLCQEALALQQQTPKSFNSLLKEILVAAPDPDPKLLKYLESCGTLPIQAVDVKHARQGFFIIDIRSNDDYTKGHFPQSYNIPRELEFTREEIWNVLSGFNAYYTNKTAKPCHFAICFGKHRRQRKEATNLCLDLIRRGVERISIVQEPVLADEGEHDTDKCQRCELNRDLLFTANKEDESEPRYKRYLTGIWYSYLNEDHISGFSSPISSISNSPRTHEIRKQIYENNDTEFTSNRGTVSARSTEIDTTSFTVQDCVKMLWTNKLREGEAWLEERKSIDPRCALHLVEAGFLRAILAGDKNSRNIALERLKYAETVADSFVKTLEPNANKLLELKGTTVTPSEALKVLKASQQARLALVVSAEVLLLRAGNEILHKSYFRGSIIFRQSWKQYQKCKKLTEVQREIEEQYFTRDEIRMKLSQIIEDDIQNFLSFGLGVFYLSLSMAPPNVVRLAKHAAGMEADQAEGLKLIYECINTKVGVRVPLALMFVLFWLLIYIPDFVPGKEDRYKEAAELIRFGSHYYQKSVYFYWLQSYMSHKQGNLEKSLKLLEKSIRTIAGFGLETVPVRLVFEKGWVLFLCQEWSPAISCLDQAMQHDSPTPFILLLLGISNCMIGELPEAERYFTKLTKIDLEKNSIERWIGRRAKRFLARRWFQLFPFELIFITDQLSGMKIDWIENVLEFLERIEIDQPSLPQARNFFSMGRENDEESDEYAILLLIKGSLLRLLGRLREAVNILETVLKYQNSTLNETWVIPHAIYELGMIFVRGRDWFTAADTLRKAKNFKKYDFRRSLNFKLNAALDFISGEESKEYKENKR